MDPEQRTPREMTYKVGWKRSKIVSAPNKTEALPEATGQPDPYRTVPEPLRPAVRFNDNVLWKQTPIPPVKLMKVVLILLPAAVFVLFVWMVYWLSHYS
ncbi:hypothetical protein ACFQI7_21610 [Paenibacillus allorhizosphaerae]|uniref:Uncharacterized protein n=1 Tax=Paenibacillus allorhizosphaerae TaxID=2849866 RepID=A0ABN7TQ77_9BACL|nr:hypothetical protein [Paenibacillus allorhizosphaerae]CAG7650962.1 hypothetical protein PAECIP111802_04849 [Paenibacillus allorhizosphaerae]